MAFMAQLGGIPMEHRKSIKTVGVKGPLAGAAKSDLLHHVDAISLALKNWNDIEALKLLRLHWPEIAAAIRSRSGIPERIAVPGLHPLAAPGAHRRISPFEEVIDSAANDGGPIPMPPLRTFP
jgi:hypothetical protein